MQAGIWVSRDSFLSVGIEVVDKAFPFLFAERAVATGSRSSRRSGFLEPARAAEAQSPRAEADAPQSGPASAGEAASQTMPPAMPQSRNKA